MEFSEIRYNFRYKALLGEIKLKEDNKKAKQVEMEFTWGTGLDKKSESKNKVVEEELTPFEQILEKKRLKKKSKKEERKQKFKAEKASGSEDSEEDQNGYSSDDVDVDLNDPYFAEEFANGEFDKPKKPKKKVKEVNPESEDEEARKQAELALLLDDGQDEKAHFSLKKIQDSEDMSKSKRKRKFKKGKGKEEKKPEAADNFKMNVGDNRFAAVFSEPDFNIDPTDSHFKKTKGMEVLIHEKLKRRQPDELPKDSAKKPKKDVSMKILIKNVKRKIAHSK